MSRESVLPVHEELDSLLFYPVPYEGEEPSKNVFCTGTAPDQQAIPAVECRICALAMDLIRGCTGILTLDRGVFFALGGCAMGMHLMRRIGSNGRYYLPMPDSMLLLNWKHFPWTWGASDSFIARMALVIFVPGLLAFVFGCFALHSRIKGVYFSIVPQVPEAHRVRAPERVREPRARAEGRPRASSPASSRTSAASSACVADRGTTAIVLVEQFHDFAAELADQYLVMEHGEIIKRGRGADMDADGVRALTSI